MQSLQSSLARSTNENTLHLFQSILGKNFSQFTKQIPYDGFVTAGVHYCVLREPG